LDRIIELNTTIIAAASAVGKKEHEGSSIIIRHINNIFLKLIFPSFFIKICVFNLRYYAANGCVVQKEFYVKSTKVPPIQ
jgi:hypothetical protein